MHWPADEESPGNMSHDKAGDRTEATVPASMASPSADNRKILILRHVGNDPCRGSGLRYQLSLDAFRAQGGSLTFEDALGL